MTHLPPLPLPPGLTSRRIAGVNGLDMHILEAGAGVDAGSQVVGRGNEAAAPRPVVLLLHGFPELAWSWRKVMPLLADAGWRVIAPDQRGYGRTTGGDAAYDGDYCTSHLFNLVRDVLALVAALGIARVDAVVGHDFGSPVAAWCALIRPDVFGALVLMSAPFAGPPGWPAAVAVPPGPDLHAQLAALPRPRLHYQRYYASRAADADMRHAPQGLHAFLRAYHHVKSGDAIPEGSRDLPHPLSAASADALAELPTYYVMDLGRTMAETVAEAMPDGAAIAACRWLPDDELAVIVGEFERTGFQGGLQWYRSGVDPQHAAQLRLFAGRRIEVPACFIAGDRDWGVHQAPGAFEAMRDRGCADLRGCHLIEGAGHWVPQERPDEVGRMLIGFLRDL